MIEEFFQGVIAILTVVFFFYGSFLLIEDSIKQRGKPKRKTK